MSSGRYRYCHPSILLTFDVEDWFQVENLRSWVSPLSWERLELRVEKSTHRILDIMDAFSRAPSGAIRATFFVLGWIADRLPGLVSEIHQRGHEVASHGFGHNIYSLPTPRPLEEELRTCKEQLEQIIGNRVFGYRAPNFSMHHQQLEAVRYAGFLYDSSFNAIRRRKEPGPLFRTNAKRVGIATRLCNGFYELPISNLSLAGVYIPWGGGGYFRLFPLSLFLKGVRRILCRERAYVFYAHPWEFDPEQPRIREARPLPRFRHYLNLHRTLPRFIRLIQGLSGARFLTCKQYIDHTSL